MSQFEDGEHIIYVNGSIRVKNTALGKLMSDFFCTEAKDMYYKKLSDRVRQYKETEKGVDDSEMDTINRKTTLVISQIPYIMNLTEMHFDQMNFGKLLGEGR